MSLGLGYRLPIKAVGAAEASDSDSEKEKARWVGPEGQTRWVEPKRGQER